MGRLFLATILFFSFALVQSAEPEEGPLQVVLHFMDIPYRKTRADKAKQISRNNLPSDLDVYFFAQDPGSPAGARELGARLLKAYVSEEGYCLVYFRDEGKSTGDFLDPLIIADFVQLLRELFPEQRRKICLTGYEGLVIPVQKAAVKFLPGLSYVSLGYIDRHLAVAPQQASCGGREPYPYTPSRHSRAGMQRRLDRIRDVAHPYRHARQPSEMNLEQAMVRLQIASSRSAATGMRSSADSTPQSGGPVLHFQGGLSPLTDHEDATPL